MKKGNKGITLIALIITIIVMLILVGVTVAVTLNGGLFEKTKEAARRTEEQAILEEIISMAVIENDGKINPAETAAKVGLKYTTSGSPSDLSVTGKHGVYRYKITEKEIKIIDANAPVVLHAYYYEGDGIKCEVHEDEEYTIGQAYSYTPTEVTTPLTISGTDSGIARAIENEYFDEDDIEELGFGEEGSQSISQEELSWVVLGIDENDTNKLLITSSAPTGETIVLYGAEAYNNGMDIVNNICETLYSSEEGTARGMTIEDVNNCLGFELPTLADNTQATGMCYDGDKDVWVSGKLSDLTSVKRYNDDTKNIWDMMVATSTAAYNDDGATIIPEGNKATLEATLEALGNYPVDGYYYESDDINATAIRKNVIFGENTDFIYFLACRGVYAISYSSDADAGFGPGSVYGGDAGSCCGFFNSYGSEYGDVAGVRPVVSIIPSV